MTTEKLTSLLFANIYRLNKATKEKYVPKIGDSVMEISRIYSNKLEAFGVVKEVEIDDDEDVRIIKVVDFVGKTKTIKYPNVLKVFTEPIDSQSIMQ